MGQRQVITLLARPNSGWPRYACVRHSDWAHLIVTLSAMVYMLSSPSARSQDLVSQGKDVASGQQVFNNACRTCHTIKEGDNRLGPNLYRIVGRRAGSQLNYNYSSAMREADFIWDEKKLERFIANPDGIVPGHNMRPYGGLASADDTAHVIAFLLSVAARGP